MVAVTYGGTRTATPAAVKAKTAKSAKKSKSFLARVFDAICDSQMKRAERELALHRHLLPPEFKLDRMWSRNNGQMPFGGW